MLQVSNTLERRVRYIVARTKVVPEPTQIVELTMGGQVALCMPAAAEAAHLAL